MSLAHNISIGQRTLDVFIGKDVTFDTMLLSSHTQYGLINSGFHKPSPIQLHGIPLGKCGFDLLLEAKSGTGKTAVFTVIALEKLDLKKGLQSIMLAPTREIAAQICDVIKQIGSAYEGLKVEVVMGGLPVQGDINKFKNKNVHIVVGSPGRLRHLIQDKHINTSSVRLLVIDEADKLMEKSFLPDINFIFSIIPKEKQVIMSSATYPENTRLFINKYMQNTQHICPDTNSILLGIDQKITVVKYSSNVVKQTQYRFEELLKILTKKQFKQCLIFCNYQVRVQDLHKLLTRKKWPAEQLYGLQEQTNRLDAIKKLQDYKCRILISTDLAARGIDASNVDLVINFEPPVEWQTYLHRIGRAGRFGSYGLAITILSDGKEKKDFSEMLKTLKLTLKFFWDGEIFNGIEIEESQDNNNSNNVLEQNKYDKTNPDVMWNILTCDNKESVGDDIDFETLCKSYEQSTILHTETFDDLVRSFESHKHEETSDGSHKIDKNIYESNNSFSILSSKALSLKNNFVNKEKSLNIKRPDDTHKTYLSIVINETDPAIEELRKVGLPTSFCSHKDKNRRSYKDVSHKNSDFPKKIEWKPKTNKNMKHLKEEEQTYVPKETSNHSKLKSSDCKKYCTKSYDNKVTESHVSVDYGYHSLLQHQFVFEEKYDMKPFRNSKSLRNKGFPSGFQSTKQFSKELYQNYADWYNQLKYTAKQIELAVYFDEMSKF